MSNLAYKAVRSNGSKYNVIETETGFTIFDNMEETEARKKARFFNFGGGFDGWSPRFILERINPQNS